MSDERLDRGRRRFAVRGRRLLIVSLLGLACAASPRPQPATPARVKDSAPDKLAAQRAASGNLRLGDESDRWGIDDARERKDAADQRRSPPPTPVPPTPPAGPVDVQASPAVPPVPVPPNH